MEKSVMQLQREERWREVERLMTLRALIEERDEFVSFLNDASPRQRERFGAHTWGAFELLKTQIEHLERTTYV